VGVYVYTEEKMKNEHERKVHIDRKSETESQIYTVQHDAAV
jgi:hypothetical protein